MEIALRRALAMLVAVITTAAFTCGRVSAQTAPAYVSGHISNVTFAGDGIMIMVDAGIPDNCVGTGWGWLRISSDKKTMMAFVLGLWMRGDAAQTSVTVYTGGLVDGYCRVDQIDPVG
jgi:hypothetical protein